jgi:DNA-binding NtrC family response regulator
MTESAKAKILILDNQNLLSNELLEYLEQHEYECTLPKDFEKAFQVIEQALFDIVLCDVNCFPERGLELLRRCKASCPEVAFIMLEKDGTVDSCMHYIREGAYDYVSGPFTAEIILPALHRSLERKRLREENIRFREELAAKYDFSQIIGQSAAIRSILEKIKRIAHTKSTVLITGESSTGKEVIARAIHYNSPRRDRPMVAVNCASIPRELIESEFFGHVKGSFTGAVATKRGLFEEANQSTLFLDEIGEMDLGLQVKILRAIEDEEIRRVGDTQPIRLDLRIIAATNRDLSQAVEEGKFRKDLFYRLNIVSIHIPPLRERREDIPPLAHFFLEKYRRKHNRNIQGFTQETLQQLMDCDWPGNVRELENAIEQAVVMTDEPWVKIKDISCLLPERKGSIRVSLPVSDTKLKTTLREVQKIAERELIARVIQECDGNRTQAAAKLGVSRRALLYKLKSMNLKGQEGGILQCDQNLLDLR